MQSPRIGVALGLVVLVLAGCSELDQREQADAEPDEAATDVEELEAERDEALDEVEELKAERDEALDAVEELEVERDEALDELAETEAHAAELEDEVAALEEEVADREQQLARLRDGGDDASTALSSEGFVLPSDNIYCLDEAQGLSCEIASELNPPPERECKLDWSGVYLGSDTKARPVCKGDTIRGRVEEAPVLGYGETWERDGIRCLSERTGLTCENDAGGELFLSRAEWHAR